MTITASEHRSANARLVALDGVRGIAAGVVLLYHMTYERFPQHGYLAVDLFFLLSGYVLAGAFEQKLRDGMSWLQFMRARLARLYPLYAVGLTLGLLAGLRTAGLSLVPAWAMNLAFIAGPTGQSGFVLDPPMWSLAVEVIIGAVFAAGMWRFNNRWLAACVVLAGVALVGVDLWRGGLTPNLGFVRAAFSFPLGWLMWRLRDRLKPFVGASAPWLALIAICASWLLPRGIAGDLLAVLAIYPLAVAALALSPQPSGRLAKASAWAGALSFPLYATHAVVVPIAWLLAPDPLSKLLTGAAMSLAVAWLMHRTVEPLGRRMLA